MNQTQMIHPMVEKHFQISIGHARWLSSVAQTRGIGESQIVEKALDILSGLTDIFEDGADRQGWTLLSEVSLQRVWDNDADAAYDNWRELYGVPAR